MGELSQAALNLALAEVSEQKWASTQQFFRAHTLKMKDGLPVTTVLHV